ncbi:MAG TPA: DNA translocase FtsK, partial [Patescibacteria group bacterium]|nr:DNA translocase FtsK [Patescibacteria group bacterium]
GKEWLADLAKMPHLLVAGATGSGKTVFLNSVIIGLLFENTPKDLRLILVDPKRVELTLYEGIPHLLTHVITDAQKTVNALKWAIKEMEDRFDILSKAKKRNIDSYNKSVNEEDKLPYIVIVIDELADLMSTSPQEVENAIVRLAQMARATGIHLIMATQRPSVDVITGLIKANVTSRVAFSVASSTDSRTILDFSGAEKLLGKGDMLYVSANLSKPKRLQGAYVSDEEIKKIVNHLKGELPPDYNEEVTDIPEMEKESGLGDLKEDEMLPRARELVIQSGKASASYLQRRLRVGYARAARLIDLLEEEGTIGPRKGNKAREVLVSNQENEYQEDEDELETDEFEKGGEDLEDEEDN